MWQEFLKSRIATVALSLVLILVMFMTAKVLSQKRIVDREISKINAQMERVKQNNEELSSLIQYLNTSEYQEKEAREKLNLSKEGEFVVVLPQNSKLSGAESEEPEHARPSNPKLWFNYFFNAQWNSEQIQI